MGRSLEAIREERRGSHEIEFFDGRHTMIRPPATSIVTPVTHEELSETR